MLVGDVGRLAALARDGALASATLALFHPLKFMLASPAEDAAEIVARLGPVVWVEDKYDGIRAQLHKLGPDVRLYSRDLHDISAGYPEVVDAATGLAWDGILDGEILAWRDGTVLPFIALQTRLGRKAPTAEIRAAVPVIYVAFDALGLGPGDGATVDAAPRAAAAASAAPGSTIWISRRPTRADGSLARTSRSPPTPRRSRPPSSRPAPGATRG